MAKCRFGTHIVDAVDVNKTAVLCRTPYQFAPGNQSVFVSLNGLDWTNNTVSYKYQVQIPFFIRSEFLQEVGMSIYAKMLVPIFSRRWHVNFYKNWNFNFCKKLACRFRYLAYQFCAVRQMLILSTFGHLWE